MSASPISLRPAGGPVAALGALAVLLAGCAAGPPSTAGVSTAAILGGSPEDGCRAFSNPVRRARCVASCRAAGVSCATSPSLIERLSPDLEREAALLGVEARRAYRAGDLHAARSAATQARSTLTLIGHRWQSARLMTLEARALLDLGRPARALEIAAVGLPILRGTGEAREALILHLVRGLAMLDLGDAAGGLGELAEADGLRLEMTQLRLDDAPQPGQGRLVDVYRVDNVEHSDLSGADAVDAASDEELADIDLMLARLAARLGRLDMASAALDRAEASLRGGGPARLAAGVHDGRGALLHMRGQLAGALAERGLALSIKRHAGDRAGVARQLLALSRLFMDLGHLDVAYRLASQGASLSADEGLLAEQASADVLMGRIAEELGGPQEAARGYLQALERGPEALPAGSGDRFWAEAGVWRLCRRGACDPVEPMLPAMPTRLGGRLDLPGPPLTPDAVLASALVARERLSRGQREGAAALLEGIEALMTIPLPPASSWRVHHILGLTWRELGDVLRARGHLTIAHDQLEALQSGLDVHLLRQDLSIQRRQVYEDLIDTCVGRSAPAPPSSDVWQALAVAEQMKARGPVELVSDTAPRGPSSRGARLVRHARVARALMEELQSASGEGVWESTPTVARLCEVWSGLRWGEGSATDEGRPPLPPGALRASLQGLLPERVVLLSYLIGEGRSYLWVITSGGVRLHHLPGRERIEPAVERALQAMLKMDMRGEVEYAEHLASSRALAEMVLAPALADLKGVDRIIVAADGSLRGLPFAALVVGDGEVAGELEAPTYLVERAALTQVPSAGFWAALASRDPARWSGDRPGFLAVGDPERVSADATALDVRVEFHDGSVTFVTDARPSVAFEPLAHAREEIRAVVRILKPERARVLIGDGATEEAFFSSDLKGMRHLHFATHGLTDVRPLLPEELSRRLGPAAIERLVRSEPALVFSAASGEGGDGLLRLEEIMGLELGADLVVLSACSTGRGGRDMGESADGLASAFLYAGSRRAVASLWSVADRQTSALMALLYQGLKRGVAPDEALRQAQLRLLRGGPGKEGGTRGVEGITSEAPEARRGGTRRSARLSPYYWAPFVIVGD